MISEYRKQLGSKDILIGFEFEFKAENYPRSHSLIDKFIKNHGHKFPYDKIKSTSRYGYKNKSVCIAKPDMSIEPYGIELVTPPMQLETGLDKMMKTFKAINKYGTTDKYCGFHINLSFKNKKRNDKIKYHLPLYIDENYIYKFFPNRKNNQYALSMHKDIAKNYKEQKKWKGVDQIDYNILSTHDHYMAIDLSKLKGRNKYVEFRYTGGKNYHKMTKYIKTIIGMYIYAMRQSSIKYKDDKVVDLVKNVVNKRRKKNGLKSAK